ncbi:unnamed protein product [Aureobasidium vineae]|uniref:Uncharacterized protein n=1 Tax=Aureobasidium vineae TaxID=2773715 RepID=A0A9N8JBD1_9PEZI|nr:unnamed protein product [Aureobasidium vineae]
MFTSLTQQPQQQHPTHLQIRATTTIQESDECVAHINTVCRGNVLNYARVRYDALLACCPGDWYEAENFRFCAENSYAHLCIFILTGSYPGVDRVRQSLRTTLDETDAEAAEVEAEYAAKLTDPEEEAYLIATEQDEEESVTVAGGDEEENVAVANTEVENA